MTTNEIEVYILKRGEQYYMDSTPNDYGGLYSVTYTNNIQSAYCFDTIENAKLMQSKLIDTRFGALDIVKAKAVMKPQATEEL